MIKCVLNCSQEIFYIWNLSWKAFVLEMLLVKLIAEMLVRGQLAICGTVLEGYYFCYTLVELNATWKNLHSLIQGKWPINSFLNFNYPIYFACRHNLKFENTAMTATKTLLQYVYSVYRKQLYVSLLFYHHACNVTYGKSEWSITFHWVLCSIYVR